MDPGEDVGSGKVAVEYVLKTLAPSSDSTSFAAAR